MRNQNFPTFPAEDGLLRTFFRKSEKHKKGKKCFDFLCGNFSFDLYFFPGGFKKSSYFLRFLIRTVGSPLLNGLNYISGSQGIYG